MTKRTAIYCVLTMLLLLYLAVAIPASRGADASRPYGQTLITVDDTLHVGFIDASDIRGMCLKRYGILDSLTPATLNMQDLEDFLNSQPEIENAEIIRLNDGSLSLYVRPMVPVARVFMSDSSYYINGLGKRIRSQLQYHIDVPVVSGHFDSLHTPERLLPMLRHIASDPELNALVSTIHTDARNNIFIVPVIRGHIVEIGDTSLIQDKFDRLGVMYREVLPLKGWTYYDTISVRYRGRVVATRSNKRQAPPPPDLTLDEELDSIHDFSAPLFIDDSVAH